MPYIKHHRRVKIYRAETEEIFSQEIQTAGELNFALTKIFIAYYRSHKDYQGWNDIRGAAEDAVDEFRRRVIEKYEDKKIKQNGDVYPDWILDDTGP